MKKQVAVIGLGRFGISLVTTLTSTGHDVLAIDIDEKSVQAAASKTAHAIQADATNETVLKELGIADFDIAIVAIGSAIESSVLTTILLKKLGVPHVIARADTELHGSILERIGADKVVNPELEMGTRVALEATMTNISDFMSISPKQQYGIAKLTAPSYCVGETLADLGFGPKGKWELAVLLIRRGDEILVTPAAREAIKPFDVVIVAGVGDNLEKLLAEAKKKKEEAH